MTTQDHPRRPTTVYYKVMQYQPENLETLYRHFEVIALDSPSDDDDTLLAEAEVCFAPLGWRFDDAKMARCPKLRCICSNTTGVPHIDMEAAACRGIAVFSLKDEQEFLESITPTSEHTWGLLLALMRRTPWAHEAVLNGRWNRRPFGAPAMLSRLSLGIVGLGRLGRSVARYGQAFGMRVRYYDPYVADGAGLAERVDHLGDLVAASDVVSLHAPALPQTAGLISEAVIGRFKPGSWLINTARGELVDEAALLSALKDGRLAGAALDVLDDEFRPGFSCSDHPLVAYARDHDNLLLTPHIGGSTRDAWRETEGRVIGMAIAYLAGGAGMACP